MLMTVTMESAVFMGKNYLNNCQSIANTTVLTLKQMFDTFTRLVSEQDEISELDTIGGEKHSWKYLSLIGDERVINLQRTKVYVFSDSVIVLVRFSKHPNRTMHGNEDWDGSKLLKITETLTESTASQWNSSGIFSQDTTRCRQLNEEVKSLLLRLDETPDNFTGRIIFMSILNDISCGSTDNEEECLLNAKLVSLDAKRCGKGQWSFIGPGSEKKWYCITVDSPQGVWDNMSEGCRWNSQKVDVQFSVLRAHCPEVDSKAKVMENCRDTMQPIWKRLRLFFA